MSINPGNRQSENQMNGALWTWVLEKTWKIDTKVLRKKDFIGNGTEFIKMMRD